jgi:hypothetical protein
VTNYLQNTENFNTCWIYQKHHFWGTKPPCWTRTYYTHILVCRVIQKYWNTLKTLWPFILLFRCFVPADYKLPCYKHTSTACLYNATHNPSVVYFYSSILDEYQKQPTYILVFKIDKFVECCFVLCIFTNTYRKEPMNIRSREWGSQPVGPSLTLGLPLFIWLQQQLALATIKILCHSRREYWREDPYCNTSISVLLSY